MQLCSAPASARAGLELHEWWVPGGCLTACTCSEGCDGWPPRGGAAGKGAVAGLAVQNHSEQDRCMSGGHQPV